MNILSSIWLKLSKFFTPVQNFFNDNFWDIFAKKFKNFINNREIVDLACGPGDMCNYVSPKKYLGVDLNPNYIEFASKKYTNNTRGFKLGDITKATLPKADTIFFVSAAHHLSDKQMTTLANNISKTSFNYFIVVDGIPQGVFAPLLSWLDAVLGGGKYFKDENQIASLLGKKLKIVEKGRFTAGKSFYWYPYVIAKK